jgi:hypothetical protein
VRREDLGRKFLERFMIKVDLDNFERSRFVLASRFV